MADVRKRIIEIIATECELEADKIVPDASLDDLGISSVDLVQVMFQIEEEFDVFLADEEVGADTQSVGELLEAVENGKTGVEVALGQLVVHYRAVLLEFLDIGGSIRSGLSLHRIA